MSSIYGLKIQQMDVKGAYLNGILKEHIYMHQPEGYEDQTVRVCELIKTLYGLEQSGREWNNQFNKKLTNFGFYCLQSDLCVYIKHKNDDFIIIMVWVNDLLLFASLDKIMRETKTFLQSEWEVTNLGEPNEIIGIEITQKPDSITILQQAYIESILC
jgi:Reverse transcriptase (RNA-dependent DNA polymerase)